MADHQARRDELIGAALAGELSADEQRELDDLAAGDPALLVEISELQQTSDRLAGSGVRWSDAQPSTDVALRIDSATATTPRRPVREWARPATLLIAAALVAVGAVGSTVVQGLNDSAPTGPPGTLGVMEPIRFSGAPAESTIKASLVAHTWGTETDLTIDGLQRGKTFAVVLIDGAGRERGAGTFLGAGATVLCRMNSALLREDVAAVQIRSADGEIVASAHVPDVA